MLQHTIERLNVSLLFTVKITHNLRIHTENTFLCAHLATVCPLPSVEKLKKIHLG